MQPNQDETRERIVFSALNLFSARGIAHASMQEIAYQAGLTRVTVYRHFRGKKDLVRAAFLRMEEVFQAGLADLQKDPPADWRVVLDRIGEGLNALPRIDEFSLSAELKRTYPDVYEQVQAARTAVLDGIFGHVFAAAAREGLLRPGLNRALVHAAFWELSLSFFDNPRFQATGVSGPQAFHDMTDLLLHGVLLDRSADGGQMDKPSGEGNS